jgi:hypothetical protein
MEKICKNCKWWNRPCTINNSCDRVSNDKSLIFIDVRVEDDYGLQINMITCPEFGCNQFESKEIITNEKD